MKTTKAQRNALFNRFGGRCAYCGAPLGLRWHADHVEPVRRGLVFQQGKGLVPNGQMDRPENDRFDNLMPSCAPCNIDKHSMSLEAWRQKLQSACDVLGRNNPTYRHARRFGLVVETAKPVLFHFEAQEARQ